MIDKKEPSFVFVMEQHSRKQSVCNKIRVHCFPHWSSVSTTIPHLEVKDCLFSLSIRIINLSPCYLCLLHLRIFEYPILSEDAVSSVCCLRGNTLLQVVQQGGHGKQMMIMFICGWPGQHSSPSLPLLCFIPLPPFVFYSSVITPTYPE